MTYRARGLPSWAQVLAYGAALVVVGSSGYLVFRAFAAQTAVPDGLLFLAAVAGIASFFSPCAFPLLPSYLAFYSTTQTSSWRSVLRLGSAAALGVIAFDLILGAVMGLLGSSVGSSLSISSGTPSLPVLVYRGLVGALLLLLGLAQLARRNLKPRIAEALAFWSRPQRQTNRSPGTTLFLYGLGYNAAGMGCTGPILAGLMIASLTAGGFAAALTAFFVFALTMGVLMLAVSMLVAASHEQLLRQLKQAGAKVRTLGALAMLGVGAFQLYSVIDLDWFRRLFFP